MTIKDGYNGEPWDIRIGVAREGRHAEVWMEGTVPLGGGKIERKEVLLYASLDELLALRDEINAAVKELCGV